jgi:two-component system, NarL family, response regulator
MSTPIRYLIVDDHPAFRMGIVAALEDEVGLSCCGQAGTAAEALQLHAASRPDVVLLDLRLPDLGGVECALALRKDNERVGILVLTTFESDEDIFRAINSGVNGYLLKDASLSTIASSIRRIAKGEQVITKEQAIRARRRKLIPELSAREMDLLRCLAEGLINKEMAHQLKIGEETVKSYLRNLYTKLDVEDRTQAVVKAMRIGLLRA